MQNFIHTDINSANRRIAVSLGTLLLLILFLWNYSNSNGIVRGGEEDEGSGFGGTGRTLTPGAGGGFGGTGVQPYLGLNSANEIEILIDPATRDLAITEQIIAIAPSEFKDFTPVQAVARVMDERLITRDSSAIQIDEEIQRRVMNQSLALAQLRHEITINVSEPEIEILYTEPNSPNNSPTELTSWADLARLIGASPRQADADETEADSARPLERPERLSRPELPPVQSFRPVQRTAILPPRIKPLKL